MKYPQILLVIAALVVTGCKSKYPDLADGLYADIQTQKGDILVQLEYEKAPITVANFVSLAEGTNDFVSEKFKGKKFYDSLTFHRVVKDFVIQGGDPLATGTGGPGYKFKDEFDPTLKHDGPGILSMANGGPNANGSQFFVTHKETPWLDGKHSVFGHVIQGQSVVDSIAQGDAMKTIEIIRIGSSAKQFDAPQVMSDYFEEEAKAEEALANMKEELVSEFEGQKSEAKELPSGLKYFVLKKGDGPKPRTGSMVMVEYAGFLANGDLFDTSVLEIAEKLKAVNQRKLQAGQYQAVPMEYGPEARLITGFKEGLQLMNVGDKLRLFIPSHLGYGERGIPGVIPGNSDLVFDIEITGPAE